MQLADIEPGLHVIWDDGPSVETRNNIVQKIDAFHHRTFPSKFERFALLAPGCYGSRIIDFGRRISPARMSARVGDRLPDRVETGHRAGRLV